MANVKIRETISHGNYCNVRTVEVFEINPVTVDAVVVSSAYCYGSLANDKDQAQLDRLVANLREGVASELGWSTFEVVE